LKTPLESEKANEQSNNRSARAEKTRNPLNAPNISLNHTPTPNLAEVILFDVIAVTLQSVVLLLDAFLTYRWKLSKQGRLVSQAAFPLVLAGTIGLTAGMLICSAVVEKSTGEVWYRFKKGQPRQPIKLLWLQKKGVVSDQNFESYAIFAAKERSAVVASTRKKNVPSTRKKYIPFTRKKSIQQEIVEFDNEEFTLKTISIDLVTLVGVFLSVVGYVVQFVGFRQMHWLATIIQLILSATMTAIRSWMRRDLSSEPFHQKLQEGHEMDWLATRDRLYGPNDRADSDSMSSSPPSSPEEITRSPRTLPHTISKLLQDGVFWEREKPQPWYGGDADRYRYKWFIVDCCVSDMKTASTIQGSGSQAETVTLPETVDTIVQGGMELNIADAVLGVRERINNLIGWNSPVQEAASSLTYAIDAVMNHVLDPHLFTMSEEFNRKFFQGGGFEWGFQVGKAKETVYLHVSSGTGQSRTIRPSIEAALSLWVYELSLAEANLPSSREKHPVKNAWRLGPKTDDLERDCIWWVFRESERRYEPGPRSRPFGDRPGWPEEIETDQSSPSIFREFGPGLTIKSNDGNGKCAEALSMVLDSGYDVHRMCAWHLFALFMCWISESILEVNGRTSFDSQLENVHGWLPNSVKLVNSSLQSLAIEIEASKLCTQEEASMTIVPPLSMAGKLPISTALIDCGLEVARSFEKKQNWKAATEVYMELLRTCRSFDPDSEMPARSLAVSAEFLTLLCRAEEVYQIRGDETTVGENKRLRNLMEAKMERSHPETLRSLAAIYGCQRETQKRRNLSIVQSSAPPEQFDAELDAELEAQRIPQDLSRYLAIISRYQEDQEDQTLQGHERENLLEECNQRITHAKRMIQDLYRIWLWNDLFADVVGNDYYALLQHLENAKNLSLDIEAQDILGWSLLHYAAQNVSESKKDEGRCLQALLDKGLDVNRPNTLGFTPLHCAVKAEMSSSIDILVKYGARIDAKSVDGQTALHIAARSRDGGLASALCEKGADIEARDNFEQTPLHIAALTGSIGVVLLLLDWKAKSRVREASGLTPLHAICGQTQTSEWVGDVIDRFSKDGAALEATDHNGQTPLHFAARSGCTEALEVLLKPSGRANVMVMDAASMIPFHVAAKYCQFKSAEWLLRHTDDRKTMIHTRDRNGRTPLHYSVNSASAKPADRVRFVKFLLKEGAVVKGGDKYGSTPLHLCKDKEVLELLLKHGGDIHAKDQNGREPLHIMTLSGNVHAMELLLLDSARIDAKDEKGMTPLHYAILHSAIQIDDQIDDSRPCLKHTIPLGPEEVGGKDLRPLRLLLKWNAPLNAEDDYGDMALELAMKSVKRRAVDVLLQEYKTRNAKFRSRTLHSAARFGYLEIVKLSLSDPSLHVNEDDKDGGTPLRVAMMFGHQEIVELLLRDPSVHVNEKDKNGRTLLHYAAEFGNLDTVKQLLSDDSICVSEKDENGMTPLHVAVKWGRMTIADHLLWSGADQSFKNKSGQTPVELIGDLETRESYKKEWSKWVDLSRV
jgi:ankyrin repeat protein